MSCAPTAPTVSGSTSGPLVLVVDDNASHRSLLVAPLRQRGFRVEEAACGEEALRRARLKDRPDLLLLDVELPDIDGYEVCRMLRVDVSFHSMPIVMVTSHDDKRERIKGLEAGADDFISKPPLAAELFARVRSLLRVKSLHDQVLQQRDELARAAGLLTAQVEARSRENEKLARLKRYFSPALAKRLMGDAQVDPWASHRSEITVLFADLRGFTPFAEAVDPSTLMSVLSEFHAAAGEAIHDHDGTLERFTGDGFMVFFNDPQPQADHAKRALALAAELQRRGALLEADWQSRGFSLGLGLGLARGLATLGGVGSASRMDYTAIGRVTNRAARLCAAALEGEALVCLSVWEALAEHERPACRALPQKLLLRGVTEPVTAMRMLRS